ncbi:uncharacterized protein GLRG_10413 [Colletotrichum graminicola M1.001]|uniref:BTB domain-containing protein n=1 Tax=Colletotrichum graminicola (strain M1.001 / M2 / FGSC 10212) TaxID=645133 RepID=E3QWN1_COLGM|nr:uncharacterized protein GLRG_10413 [Colletotrichum graminicola M1.001]EFQ35269.1 hypothetical protein GLRG_10413 [Colletotrichum graminicola M1.001]
MSRKKLGGKQTAPLSSPGDNNSRRGRISALFGRGPDDSGDTARYSVASGKEEEPIKNGFTNSTEQDSQNKTSANTYMDDHINEVARDLNSAVVDVTQKVIPSFLIPSRVTKSPIHRHKRASSSYKIVDKNTADAVLLPAVPYTPSSDENRDRIYSKNHASAKGNAQAGLSNQPPMANQKAFEEVQLLASTTYGTPGLPNSNKMKVFRSDKNIDKNPHLLPSTNYNSPEAMCSIPEALRNSALLTEKISPLPSTPRVESDLISKIPQTDIAPAEGNHSPSSTSLVTSTPLHGVLKVTASDTIPSDKKVRFAVAPFSKAAKAEDSSGDSNDANQTFKQDIDDVKVAPESILSPVIWDKGFEPKIWLKDGKPTLFKPKKEPDYYTNPLWSRQYPEIFSNELRVVPQAAGYAESATSTDGSQYHKTSASSSNANFQMGNTFPMNTESNADMSFDAGTSTRLATSTVTQGGSNTLPTPASHTFFGQEFPEDTNAPPDFAQTPRYRSQVKIEVGGRRFVTTFEVLEKSPWFRNLFSIDFRNWYHDGVFHIDNDGDLFAHILRYLRTGLYPLFWDSRNGFDYPMYAMIKQQAHHYMLHDLEVWIVAQKFHDVVETQVIHQKVLIPHNQEWIHEQRLIGNHSYVISGVADHANPSSHLENGIDTLSADIGSAVVLFTAEKIVKVDMDQLRRV